MMGRRPLAIIAVSASSIHFVAAWERILSSCGSCGKSQLRTSELSGIYTYIRIHRWTSHTIGQSHCIATYRKVSLNPSIAAHRTIAAYRGISRNIAEYRGISREIRGVAARSRTIAYHRRPSRDVAGRRDAAPSQDVATTRTIAGARTSRLALGVGQDFF